MKLEILVKLMKYKYIPAHATVGPSALESAPSDRKIPITLPFSSPSPVNRKKCVMVVCDVVLQHVPYLVTELCVYRVL